MREELASRLAALPTERLKVTSVDAAALVALPGAAANYSSVRRRSIRVFNDAEIGSEAGWRRLERAVERVCTELLDQSGAGAPH